MQKNYIYYLAQFFTLGTYFLCCGMEHANTNNHKREAKPILIKNESRCSLGFAFIEKTESRELPVYYFAVPAGKEAQTTIPKHSYVKQSRKPSLLQRIFLCIKSNEEEEILDQLPESSSGKYIYRAGSLEAMHTNHTGEELTEERTITQEEALCTWREMIEAAEKNKKN